MSLLSNIQPTRLATRLAVTLPVTVAPRPDQRPPLQCKSVDLSDRGVGLEGPVPSGQPECILTFHISRNNRVSLTGRVCWTSPGQNGRPCRSGFLFLDRDSPERAKLRQYLAQYILDRERIRGRKIPSTIQSELVHFSNRRGARIVGFYDHPVGQTYQPNAPFLLIPPAYGEHKTSALLLSYTFVANGFHALRFDATNHVGESDGDIQHFTLSQHEEDIHAALDYLENCFQAYPIAVCATSLGARTALKAASCDPRIRFLGLLVPVVDLRKTLQAVHLEDLLGEYLRGKSWGVTNVLGHNVDLDCFLEDAIVHNYDSFETTRSDLRSMRMPLIVQAAERDAWVSVHDIREAFLAVPHREAELALLGDSMHRLEENPNVLQSTLTTFARNVAGYLNPIYKSETAIRPPMKEVVLQRRLERERAKYHTENTTHEELEFWRRYLADFTYIRHFDDYRQLAEDCFDLLAPIEEEKIFMDAGCGSGNLAFFLAAKNLRLHYIGLDFVYDAMVETREEIMEQQRVARMSSEAFSSLAFLRGDLNYPLPLYDNAIDLIACNLVLSYLDDPLQTIREFTRALKPGGKIVVSSLKPAADLSQIYRNFAEAATTREQIREAQHLLTNAGGINLKEANGIYQYFSIGELRLLLETAGAIPETSCMTFGNQAVIVSARKLSRYDILRPQRTY